MPAMREERKPSAAIHISLKGGGLGGESGGGGVPYGPRHLPRHTYFTALWLALAAVVMFFAAFASSYVVRRGISNDWRALRLPPILWFNTLLLLASSGALEWARRSLAKRAGAGFGRAWSLATALGAAFLFGQVWAWRTLQVQGVYLASNPSHSFFYLLTTLHALHLLVGLGALAYVAFQNRRLRITPGQCLAVDLSAAYWHFLDGLWIFVFGLLLLWR